MNTVKTLFATLILIVSASAQAAVIETTSSWDGSQSIQPFGETNTATYGQTFTVGADSSLNSFSFFINDSVNPDYVDFEAYVMSWDGSMATGSILYQSAGMSTTNNGGLDGMEQFTINTGGLDLTAGSQYVAFFSASNLFDGIVGTSVVGGMGTNPYADGNFVYMNNGSDFSQLTAASWTQWAAYDLAFEMDFGAAGVSEPATLLLMGLGLAGLGFSARKKSA